MGIGRNAQTAKNKNERKGRAGKQPKHQRIPGQGFVKKVEIMKIGKKRRTQRHCNGAAHISLHVKKSMNQNDQARY